MVTDEQVRLLISLLTQGIPQVTAAAKAGMSERSARKYARSGCAPSQVKVPHTWGTRPDPFEDVWPEIEALLRQDGGLQAKTIWTELNERHAGRFSVGQSRMLQRRLLAWRVTSGPEREVFFLRVKVTVSPGLTPCEGFTRSPLRWTLPPPTATAAEERDLNNRTPNSQRSIRMAPGPVSSRALMPDGV